jgi:hypothetical protein
MSSFLAIPGALAGAVQGAFVGLILGHLIANVHAENLDGPPSTDVVDVLIAAISGMIVGASLAIQNKGRKAYLFGVWARVAPVAACWPFWRLAAMQPQWGGRFVFRLTGAWLALVGVAVIGQIVARAFLDPTTESRLARAIASGKRRRFGDYLLYGSIAGGVLLMGIFLTGAFTADFQRTPGGGQCVLTRTRWLGFVETEHEVIDKLRGWRRTDGEHAIELLTDDGVVRVPGERVYYATLAGKISRSLDAFLESAEYSLVLNERTPWAPPPVILLIACGALCYGAFLDPLTEFPTFLNRAIGIATGLCGMFGLVWLWLMRSDASG